MCLSETYEQSAVRLEWRCARGHEWEARLQDVNRGSWCPSCSAGRREGECREIFESLLGVKMPNSGADWLPPRRRLDGYNEELRLAFEYNGAQHYRYVPHFHRGGPQDLEQQQQDRDRAVEAACVESWVALIVIPYTVADLERFIRKELFQLGYIQR